MDVDSEIQAVVGQLQAFADDYRALGHLTGSAPFWSFPH